MKTLMESWNVKINSEQEDRETERHLSCAWINEI